MSLRLVAPVTDVEPTPPIVSAQLGHYLEEDNLLRVLVEDPGQLAAELAGQQSRDPGPELVEAFLLLIERERPHQLRRLNRAIRRARSLSVHQRRLLADAAAGPVTIDRTNSNAMNGLVRRGLCCRWSFGGATLLGKLVDERLPDPKPPADVEVALAGALVTIRLAGAVAVTGRLIVGVGLVDQRWTRGASLTDAQWRTAARLWDRQRVGRRRKR